jgi:hypothetical protein
MDSVPPEGPAASAVRSIANDACMTYETVEKDSQTGKFVTRRITKQGPTGLITTGTRPLDDQMGTRCFTVNIPDDVDQTRAIMRAQADAAQGDNEIEINVLPFHAFQRWLAASSDRKVIVPFARELAELVPAEAVRIRRDFKQLLTVIKTLALFSHTNRDRNTTRAIIATITDYARARQLLAPSLDAIIAGDITPAVRQTVEAINNGEQLSQAQLADRLKLCKSTVHYRVCRALCGGWLINRESRRGYPAQLSRGTPMPEERSALPPPEQLLDAFESRIHRSNGHSNTSKPLTAEGLGEGEFEQSNENRTNGANYICEPDDEVKL